MAVEFTHAPRLPHTANLRSPFFIGTMSRRRSRNLQVSRDSSKSENSNPARTGLLNSGCYFSMTFCGTSILIVEDDADNAETLAKLVKGWALRSPIELPS